MRRVSFPKGGLYGGQTHRLADATLASGTGITEALHAGAEQVILVTPVSEDPDPPARRRGPRAHADGAIALLDGRALTRSYGAEFIQEPFTTDLADVEAFFADGAAA